MHYINITVREKSARADDRARIVCGNSDYAVRFDFDEEWEAYDLKTARFITEGGFFTDVQFTGSDCAVPVLTGTRTLLVGVFAGDVRTTTPAYIPAIPCITDNGGIPAAPPPDVYAQLMNRFAALEAPAAVLYTEQELTNEQKAQARKNIGAGTGTGEVTSTAIETALGYTPVKPDDLPTVPTDTIAANTAARHTHANKAAIDGITGQVTADKVNKPDHTTDLVQYGAFQIAAQQIIAQIPTVPEALKNPNALTIKIGSTTVTYDGSEAKTIEIADGTEVSY